MKNKLLHIKEQVFSGRSALEEKQIHKILDSLEALMGRLIKEEEPEEQEIKEFSEIFEGLTHANLSKDFLAEINVDRFYGFGEFLSNNSNYDSVIACIHNYLNLFRHSEFLRRIYGEKGWEKLIQDLIIKSNFNVEVLFRQRVNQYSSKTLFKVLHGQNQIDYSWENVFDNVQVYSKGLLGLLKSEKSENTHIAFLMENSLAMVEMDMACLTSGIINIMIPANSVPKHINYILNKTKAEIVIVSNEKQLAKLKEIKSELVHLKKVVLIEGNSSEEWVISLRRLKNEYGKTKSKPFEIKSVHDLATIMFTSGTTGEPKGIMFSHLNIIYKRFCRAMALPKIGDRDRFLSYLPLYHTFGRWLEMMGAIFWGAEYAFMENPSANTMILNMQMVKPTIFISIPKKWVQIYENITARIDIEVEEDEDIQNVVNEVTGGRLKWGLSAAGYLQPDIFRFFQRYGIELMSGFGMTEATGGITMTPPGEYKDDSLGKPLPGIEIKVSDDGELLIKGSYVMIGYYGEDTSETFDENGWFATGDIMKMDDDGSIQIIDRKKEIYKNIKGETIAPQKIENYFRDFEFVSQVFLVGDHMPYNTVLIYPNYDTDNPVIKEMTEQQRQEYFSSVIVTVNKFLAPYESIVDFRIIDRPFLQKKGELTPKKTYKRRVIEQNFEETINSMYEKSYSPIFVNGLEVRIPNWFFREKGCLSRDIVPVKDGISIPKLQTSLKVVNCDDETTFQIGDFCYKFEKNCVELQRLIINPMYWVGNEALFNFTGDSILQWYRHQNRDARISFRSKEKEKIISNDLREKMKVIMEAGEYSLYGLHIASILLQSVDSNDAMLGIQYLREILNDKSLTIYYLAVELLFRPHLTENAITVRREMFKTAIEKLSYENSYEILKTYLRYNPDLLDETMQYAVAENSKGEQRIASVERVLKEEVATNENEKELTIPMTSLLELLAVYGIQHPTTYERIRQILVRYELKNDFPELAGKARNAKLKLRDGFRNWLGANQNVAVDVETGEEYGWEDVVTMEEGIDKNDGEKIIESITEKPILREAIFLFSKGTLVRLNNILPGGIWISHYSDLEHKTVYRVSVQTRMQGSFDIMFHFNKNLPWDKVIEKTNWLILAGSRFFIQELVEDFGGYWDEYDLWTQKYIPGETVEKYLNRETRKLDENRKERLKNLWTFFVWNASAAYINFWKLTLYQLELVDPTPSNVIIPPHDYQTGTRFVSLSDRMEHENLFGLITNFYYKFIKPVEDKYAFLKKKSIWNYLFSGLINAEGEEQGFKVLEEFKKELKSNREFEKKSIVEERLDVFLNSIKEKGFIPKQLFFAIKRFHRWYKLNSHATLEAQAEMLSELFDTYNLPELEKIQKSTRTRFFLETVFSDSKESFRKALYDLINRQKNEQLNNEELIEELSKIQHEFTLTKKESFFLTRLSYPHIKPTDTAAIMSVKGEGVSAANLVVELEDYDGNSYFIRSPISPKEISRLHQLFIDASLLVHFRPEHRFLVALSERGYIIGGLFYTLSDNRTAHMEKIVVSNKYRRKGISEGLMNEFFNRMRDANNKYVTTGFFRPEYFYRFGFKIERKYSGLVKEL